MEPRKAFNFFYSYYLAAKKIEDAQAQAAFLMAVCQYALEGTEPEIDGLASAMFELARPNLDASRAKSDGGANGGRKSQANRKQAESKSQANRKDTSSIRQACPKDTSSTPQAIKDKGLRIKDKEHSPNGENTPKPPTEPKVQFAEFVTMTNAEHEALLATHGAADTARLIEILDDYKGSSGKTYKSDYRAIKSWVVGKLNEEKARQAKSVPRETPSASNTATATDLGQRADVSFVASYLKARTEEANST
jgi:hypothetical protein